MTVTLVLDTHQDGIVLRSTYHVFDLYVNYLGDKILDGWMESNETMHVIAKDGHPEDVSVLDVLPTRISENGMVAIAVINKHMSESRRILLKTEFSQNGKEYRMISVNGDCPDAYNDVDQEQVTLSEGKWQTMPDKLQVSIQPYSVNVIQIR